VRASAQLYKTAYLDTIDNIFKIARAIEILNKALSRQRKSADPAPRLRRQGAPHRVLGNI